jgi:hypothetical protein
LSNAADPSRDDGLLAMRPTVPFDAERAVAPVERFLHAVLRPVLKLQNPALLDMVAADLRARDPAFAVADPDAQRARLGALLTQNHRLRQVLLGMVLGALTADERRVYLAHESEIRRRVAALLAERLRSQVEDLASRARA